MAPEGNLRARATTRPRRSGPRVGPARCPRASTWRARDSPASALEGDPEASVVLSAAGAEAVRSEPFAELFREKLATGRLDVFALDGEIPMYLGLVDDAVENDEGIPRGLFQSTDEQSRA